MAIDQIEFQEREKLGIPDMIVDFVRHGQARYRDEEFISGDVQGELTEEGVKQVEKAAQNLADDIDPTQELVAMWISPKKRAGQAAQIIENTLALQGILPIKKSIKESLSDVKLFGYSKEVDKIMQEQEQNNRYWMDVWKNLENLPQEVESPEDVRRRANRLITYLNRVAEKVVPESGKRLHFILVGHEETVQDLLEKAFGIGVEEGEGQSNGEIIRIGLYRESKNHNPRLALSFRGLSRTMEFNSQKREILT